MRRTLGLMSLLLLLKSFGFASLVFPRFKSLTASPEGVVIYYCDSNEIFKFDLEGKFLGKLQFMAEEKPIFDPIVFVGSDGRYQVVSYVENEDYRIVRTKLYQFDSSGNLLVQQVLDGEWDMLMRPEGTIYISQIIDHKLAIFILNMKTGEREFYAEHPLESQDDVFNFRLANKVEWTIDSKGRVIILLSKLKFGKGKLEVYGRTGNLENRWDVQPEPATSVSYIKDVLVDETDNIYITHASWEVSPSTENSGSIMKYSPSGVLQFRIKDRIEYLQEIAVAKDGSIFMYQLGNEIFKYNSNGLFLFHWVADPPPFGLSWEERSEICKRVEVATPESPIQTVIQAAVFGSSKRSKEALQWIEERNDEDIPAVIDALVRYGDDYSDGPLDWAAAQLWDRYPDKAFVYLKARFLGGDEKIKMRLAPHLARCLKGEVPGHYETLLGMLNSTNEHARDSAEKPLADMGHIDKVVERALDDLRQAVASDQETWLLETKITSYYKQALHLLEPVLFDSKDPIRDKVRDIIVDYWDWFRDWEDNAQIPDDVIQRLKQWASNPDTYVADTAVLALTGYGLPGCQERALGIAEKCPEYLPKVVASFIGLAQADTVGFDPYAARIFSLAIQYGGRPEVEATGPLGDLVRGGPSSIQAVALQASINPLVPIDLRVTIVRALSVASMDKETIIKSLKYSESFQKDSGLALAYCQLLQEVSWDYMEDMDIRRDLRSAALSMVAFAKKRLEESTDTESSSVLVEALRALAPCAEDVDKPLVANFIKDKNSSVDVKAVAIELLSRTGGSADLEEMLVTFLKDDRLAPLAAKALAPSAHPAALAFLIDQIIQMGPYNFKANLNPKLFAPYGRQGLQALESLADYPNRVTQEWVRVALAALSDFEILPRIQKEYDDFILKQKIPPAYLIEAMILFGKDPLPKLVEFMAKQKDPCDRFGLMIFYFLNGEIVKQLGNMLLDETDVARARAITSILGEIPDKAAQNMLREMRTSHPNAEIRKAIKENR